MNKLFNKVAVAFVGIAMAIGVGVTVGNSRALLVSAADPVSTLNFTAACGGSGTANDGAKWTVTSDANESSFDSTSGIHYGTNNASVTYVQLTTSDIIGTISQVVVNCRDARATATVSVSVGGESLACTGSSTATNSSADYTFTGSESGEIVVRVDRGSSNTKAIYVKSIAVTYRTVSYVVSDLTLNKNSITLDGGDVLAEVSDTFTYSVSYSGEAGLGKVTTTITKNAVETSDMTASDNESGTITLTSSVEGTYNVAVTTVDKDSNKEAVTKNITVTVSNLYVEPNPVKVTNVNSLSIADTVYFVYETDSKAAGSLSSNVLSSTSVTIAAGEITSIGSAVGFTLGRSKNEDLTPYYTFRTTDGVLGCTTAKSLAWSNGTTTWTISISSGNATVECSDTSKGTMQFNSGSPRFTTYTSSQKIIQLYAIHATKEQVAVEFQNTYLKMNSYDAGGSHGSTAGTGLCTTYYWEAKAVYGTLTTEQKNELSSAALTRLHDWAAANGEDFNVETRAFASRANVSSFGGSQKLDSTTLIIVAVSFISLTAIGGFFLLKKRKENN